MKKSITVIFTISIMMAFFLFPASSNGQHNSTLIEIASSQVSEEEIAILYNRDLYQHDTQNIVISNHRIIKFYACPLLTVGDSIENIALLGKQHPSVLAQWYMVLDYEGQNVCLAVNEKYNRIEMSRPQQFPIDRIIDIYKNRDSCVNIKGVDCEVESIYFIEGAPQYQGLSVYLVTSKGNFVEYYKYGEYLQPVVFTESDFDTYTKAYYDYCTWYYKDEIGGTISFTKYLNEIYGTKNDINHNNEGSDTVTDIGNNSENEIASSASGCGGFSAIPAFIALACAAGAVAVIKKK